MGFPSSSQVRLMICLYVVAFLVGTAIASDDLKQCACYDDAQSTCGGSEQACQDYAISTAMKLAACVVPFILILLVHFWSCCRCCGFCGAEQPSVGVCTRQAMLFTGYTRGEVCLFKTAVLLTCVVAIAVTIPSFVVNKDVSNHAESLTIETDGFIDDVKTSLAFVVSHFLALEDAPDSAKQSVRDTRDEVFEKLDDLPYDSETVLDYNQMREDHTMHFLIAVVVFLAACLMVTVFGVSRMRVVVALKGYGTSIALVLMVVTCVYGFLATVGTDACLDYDYYATELYGSIAEPVGCAAASPMGPASGVREALELYEDAKSSFIGRVCDDYMSQTSMLCSVAFNCPASTCVDRTVHAFGTVLTESTARSSLVGCTPPCSIADCAEDCQDGTVKAAASTVVNAYNEYAPRMYAIDRELYPLASCLRVKVYLARMRGPLCGMVDSVDVTFKCLLAVQWLQVGIFIFLTLARKRFIAAARATVLSKAYPDDITGGHT
ncbi:hypothetical protein DIPPA_56131 [Diplonema papillatum]|nr:hypothetical protein DIPPA_56131 [Diplonema papillatum]